MLRLQGEYDKRYLFKKIRKKKGKTVKLDVCNAGSLFLIQAVVLYNNSN